MDHRPEQPNPFPQDNAPKEDVLNSSATSTRVRQHLVDAVARVKDRATRRLKAQGFTENPSQRTSYESGLVLRSVLRHRQTAFELAWQLRLRVEASTSPALLLSITVSDEPGGRTVLHAELAEVPVDSLGSFAPFSQLVAQLDQLDVTDIADRLGRL